MPRPRTCKKCKRPAKNHPGRMGPSCQAYLLDQDQQPPLSPEPIVTSNRFSVRQRKQADPRPDVSRTDSVDSVEPVGVTGRDMERGSQTSKRGSGGARTKLQPVSNVGEPLDPPGHADRQDGTTAVSRGPGEVMVPPALDGTTLVPDAEVSMWARPTRRSRPQLGLLSPRREVFRSSHVYGPDGEDMCLVCPGEASVRNHSQENTESSRPIFSLSDRFQPAESETTRVRRFEDRDLTRDMGPSVRNAEAQGYMDTGVNSDGVNRNVNINSSKDKSKYTELSEKITECSEWLKSTVNMASADMVNKSVVNCLDQVAALLCKLSVNDNNVPYNSSSQPRREARQVYQAMNPIDDPRGRHVPLFTNNQSAGGAHAHGVARERPHYDEVGVAPEPSRLAWNSDLIGPRRSCAYEAEHPMNDMSTVRLGGRSKFQPGSIQHKVQAQGVAAKSIEAALDGEYCEMSDFLSPIGASNHVTPNLECIMDDDNRVLYRTKRHTRKITNIDLWCQAWALYEKLLIGVFGVELHSVMSDYRQFIMEANRKYIWSAVATYDFRHRSLISSRSTLSGRLDFSSPSQDLLVTILDATAVKPNAMRCNKCKVYDHMAAGCPFPESNFKTQEKSKVQNTQIQNEICNNFNRDRCSNERCRRIHKCKQCRGVLPLSKCILSGPCSGGSKAAAPQ